MDSLTKHITHHRPGARTILRDIGANLILKHFIHLPPSVLVYNITYRCNAKCTMCENWRKGSSDELNEEDISVLMEDPLFARLEYLNISGGEPTLRDDLPEIIETIGGRLPDLKKISVNTTGLTPSLVENSCPRIIRYCTDTGRSLSIRLSLDGIGDTHEQVRNVPGAFRKVEKSLNYLMDLRNSWSFQLGIETTVQPVNINDITFIRDYAGEKGLDTVFYSALISENSYSNLARKNDILLSPGDRETFIGFLESEIENSPFLAANAYVYGKLLQHLRGDTQRHMPCPFTNQGIVMDPDGRIRYCLYSKPLDSALDRTPTSIYFDPRNLAYRDRMIRTVCRTCQSPCLAGVSLRKSVIPAIPFILERMYTCYLKKIIPSFTDRE